MGLGCVLLIMAWAFVLGILVGRGYYPENLWSGNDSREPAQQVRDTSGLQGADPEQHVLKPEELGFFDALQQEWAQGLLQSEADQDSKAETSPGQDDGPAEMAATLKQQQNKKNTQRFAYIYQVAAFQRQSQAELLQQRLEVAGIESYIQSVDKHDQRWYRVYVPHVGTSQETQELQQELKKMGLDKSFVRSKKPF